METTVRRSALFDALKAIASVVSGKQALPILSMARVEANGDTVSLTATNLDASLTVEIGSDGQEDGIVAAPVKMLKDILNAAPKDAFIHLKSLEGDSAPGISLAFDKSEYSAYGLDAEEFPDIPVVDSLAFSTPDLSDVLNRVGFAVSTDESRPLLAGILFDSDAGGVHAVATNGHILARYLFSGRPIDETFIVPNRELKAAAKWKVTSVGSQGKHSTFATEGATLSIRNIEGPYPNYQQVIPTENDKTLLVDRKLFADAVKRLSIIASDQSHRIVLDCDAVAGVTISAESPDKGKATETLDAAYGGEPITIGFDAKYILDILKRFKSDTVEVSMRSPERAVVFTSDADPDYLCLLMPLRIV